jgi:hypothetical protein
VWFDRRTNRLDRPTDRLDQPLAVDTFSRCDRKCDRQCSHAHRLGAVVANRRRFGCDGDAIRRHTYPRW